MNIFFLPPIFFNTDILQEKKTFIVLNQKGKKEIRAASTTFCFCYRRCGDIVGETFFTSVDSPALLIVTMDTNFAGHKASHKGFKLHFEKEREGIHCINAP